MNIQPLIYKFIFINALTVFTAWVCFPIMGWKLALLLTSFAMVMSSWLCVRVVTKPILFWSKQLKGIKDGSYSDRFRFFESDVREFKQLGDLLANASQILRDNFKASLRATREEDAILKSMSDGVLVLDIEEKIVVCNSMARKSLGLADTHVEGRLLFEKIRSLELQAFVQEQLKSTESAELYFDFKLLNGDKKSLIAKSAPLIGRSQRIKGIVLIVVDITQLKMLEKYRKQFVSNVSHEMKTPLTAIQGYAEVLKTPGLNSEKAISYAHIIEEQSFRLNGIVDSLLLLASIDHRKSDEGESFQKMDLISALKRTIDHQSVLFEKEGVEFKIEGIESCTVYADSQLLDIAVSNLLSNAAKYSVNDTHSIVVVKVELTSTQVVVSVVDEGPGIDPQYYGRIFERFFRVDKGRDRKIGGSGLGLSLVKNIAEYHGGSVTVSANTPKGSVFALNLPLKQRVIPGL